MTASAAAAAVFAGFAGVALALWIFHRARARPPAAPGEPRLPVELQGSLFDALDAGALIVDATDEVVLANPAARSLGLVRGDRLALAPLTRLVRDVRRLSAPGELETELTPSAEPHVARVRAWAAGGAGHVLLLVEDITEARRIETVRRDFVANVSHELKTPVGAMSLLAEALLDGVEDPAAVRRFAQRMRHESDRLSRLVQDLMDLSRVQSTSPLRTAAVVDIDAVVHEAVDRTELAAAVKKIDLVTGAPSGMAVLGDAEQLATAVANLLHNAVTYSPDGTRVAVGARPADDGLELSVTDEGIGIVPEDTERIFERFYRVDSARSRATGGTGLGLAIVKHIVANHGGRVSVWSMPGAGSTFTVHMPLAPASASGPGGSARRGGRRQTVRT